MTTWISAAVLAVLIAAPAPAQWTGPGDPAGDLLSAQRVAPQQDNPYTPPPCTGTMFADVTCSTPFDAWIEKFVADGITAGCGGGLYCPDGYVTRNQMAVFIEKAMHGTAGWTPGDLGNSNTGIGVGSLPFSATGSSNTAVGAYSLMANTSGFNNTSVGSNSLEGNTVGISNTAVGHGALYPNTSGSFNTAVGAASLNANTTASRNTAVGLGALYTQSYDPGTGPWDASNTAVGAYALQLNQPDGGNSGFNGTQNTAVGDSALLYSGTGYRDTAVGYLAGARYESITGYAGTTVNLVANTTGAYNTFIGMAGATTQVSNCTAVGQDAYCDASNQVRLGNTFVSSIGGKVAWSALSDARAKTDIADLDLGLDLVMALRPVSYRLKAGNGRIDLGFVAQDVEALLGDGYNVVDVGGDAERTLSLRYTDLIAPLVKAVQEQQAQIEAQRSRIDALETRLAALQSRPAHGGTR